MPCRSEFSDEYRPQPSLPRPEDVDFDGVIHSLLLGDLGDKQEAIDTNTRSAEIAHQQREQTRADATGHPSDQA